MGENMSIFERLKNVPDSAKKTITAGRLKGMTDISPMWRIERLTEVFGPCGIGWWYEIKRKEIVFDPETKQSAAFVDIDFYYKNPANGETSKPIPGTGGASFVAQEYKGLYLSDECYKMALTDALSVAAKSIGLGADVYNGKDKSKYADAESPKLDLDKNSETFFRCEVCGDILRPFKTKDGIYINVRRLSESGKANFGKILCEKHYSEEKSKRVGEKIGV